MILKLTIPPQAVRCVRPVVPPPHLYTSTACTCQLHLILHLHTKTHAQQPLLQTHLISHTCILYTTTTTPLTLTPTLHYTPYTQTQTHTHTHTHTQRSYHIPVLCALVSDCQVCTACFTTSTPVYYYYYPHLTHTHTHAHTHTHTHTHTHVISHTCVPLSQTVRCVWPVVPPPHLYTTTTPTSHPYLTLHPLHTHIPHIRYLCPVVSDCQVCTACCTTSPPVYYYYPHLSPPPLILYTYTPYTHTHTHTHTPTNPIHTYTYTHTHTHTHTHVISHTCIVSRRLRLSGLYGLLYHLPTFILLLPPPFMPHLILHTHTPLHTHTLHTHPHTHLHTHTNILHTRTPTHLHTHLHTPTHTTPPTHTQTQTHHITYLCPVVSDRQVCTACCTTSPTCVILLLPPPHMPHAVIPSFQRCCHQVVIVHTTPIDLLLVPRTPLSTAITH